MNSASPEGWKLANDLTRWWVDLAHDEAERTVPKAVEYGANSLIDVGHQMARSAGRTVTDEEAAELACYFYIVGKMGRWADALVAGERVSNDTLFDVGVYVRMAQRIRSNGGWPGKVASGKQIDDKITVPDTISSWGSGVITCNNVTDSCARITANHPTHGPIDPEPQRGDGPEYHADHDAWLNRNKEG